MFKALSSNTYVQQNVSKFVGLAPIVTLTYQKSTLLSVIADFKSKIWQFAKAIEFYNFSLPDQDSVAQDACK